MDSPDSSRLAKAKVAAEQCHGRIPYLRKLPVPVVGIIATVIIANIVCWAGAGVALVCAIPINLQLEERWEIQLLRKVHGLFVVF